MRRGTTPVHKFKVGIDLTGLDVLYVTYQQNGETIVEKSLEDEDVTVDAENQQILVKLSQADTLLFSSQQWNRFAPNEHRDNRVRIQLRFGFENGTRLASNIMITTVDELLKDGEI